MRCGAGGGLCLYLYVCVCVFMFLGAVFLEHWKRRQRCLQHSWDLTDVEDEEVRV